MARKKSERKPKNVGEAVGFKSYNFKTNEKTDFILGLVLMLVAIYIIIAMVSFLTTGQADQSLLESLRPGEWMNTHQVFTNYCGSFGAILSYFFLYTTFGLPSFLIPAFIILVSLKLMQAYTKLNLWKWFFGMALVMVWSSITFAKFLAPIMGDQVYNPGGNHGVFCVQHLENLVGPPGLTAILLMVAIAFLTYLSAETITVIRKALNPIGYISSKIKISVTTGPDKDSSSDDPADNAETELAEEKPEASESESESIASTVVDLTPEPAPAKSSHEPIGLSITPAAREDKAETNSDGKLTSVQVASNEEEAYGKTLNAEDILKTPINPLEPFTRYKYPTIDLLKTYDNDGKPEVDMEEIKANNAHIVEVLSNFGVTIKEIKATVGPTITLYEITPGPGVRISKIKNLEDDIALSLSALGIRIIAPIPGKGTIGIEVPNKKKNIVSMESVLNTKKFKETKMDLPISLGKTITNEVYMVDLAKIPHLLVAGATGQGKSVGLNAIITSLLYKKHPNELKFVLIDPKKVEFSIYNKIAPHFMACLPENEDEPIITDVQKVVRTLNSLCKLMDHRYDLLKMAGVNKIKDYNDKFIHHKLDLTKGHEYMPYIVVIIDEFGDLIMTAGKEVELPIARIAQLARAVGIHMVIATQRPTTNIITGTIKANFPGRMAFRVGAQIDSRTILDRKGAERLIGRGDMLFLNGGEPVRVQCAFVDTPEIETISDYIESQPGPVAPVELPEPSDDGQGGNGGGGANMSNIDPYFEEAAHAIVVSQQGSTSMVQRRFSIGYNRAGRLMDQLEAAGIVGSAQGSKPREVLIQDENSLNELLARLRS
ncbi:FtsK/SpoIIIE family DNA translocase [Prevotella sp. kh1p2]|uniref:FtsK/SpoIIIE family DNA translocase n=1 Tax=Prevotella sp. kh1p2 TaxID=1761883 RepID=UPI0008B07420|nr:DNA translocase FtsK [Prevotella sp. kh1p2]SET05282.1 DNA segregation ATPase FtsK/SpoIIIE, S-DNA-T family [Prevotella sp. kh1p2]SNU11770.1 DNA segregation ATPase FtsK/SpoIIIE, S-DNA-T family [Prevotellaceae bacterium KH2P17]